MIGLNSSIKPIIFCALIVALFVTGYLSESSRLDRDRSDWKKISPFTAVSFEGEAIVVVYEGVDYEALSIEGINSEDLIKVARREFGNHWQKRIREDIAEVLLAGGAPDTVYVDLELKNLQTGERITVADAEMTRENRSKSYGSL